MSGSRLIVRIVQHTVMAAIFGEICDEPMSAVLNSDDSYAIDPVQ